MKIRDLMSTNVVTITEDTSIHDARKIMEAHKIRRLPVMKKDKLVGLVTEHMLLVLCPESSVSYFGNLSCRRNVAKCTKLEYRNPKSLAQT